MSQSTAARRARKSSASQIDAVEPAAPSAVDQLAAAVAAAPGRWKDRLVYADALEDAGRAEDAEWQREIAACVRDMDAKAANKLDWLRQWAAPFEFRERQAPHGLSSGHGHGHWNPEVIERYVSIADAALAEVMPRVLRAYVRRLAAAGESTGVTPPDSFNDCFVNSWSGSTCSPLDREIAEAAWPLVRERVAAYDAERAAKYEELRLAMSQADDE